MHRQKKNTRKSCQLIEKSKMLVQNSAKYVLTLYEWVAIVSGTTPALCDHLSCFKQKTSVEMHLINSKKVHVPRRIKWEGCCCFWIVNNSSKHKQESSRFSFSVVLLENTQLAYIVFCVFRFFDILLILSYLITTFRWIWFEFFLLCCFFVTKKECRKLDLTNCIAITKHKSSSVPCIVASEWNNLYKEILFLRIPRFFSRSDKAK